MSLFIKMRSGAERLGATQAARLNGASRFAPVHIVFYLGGMSHEALAKWDGVSCFPALGAAA